MLTSWSLIWLLATILLVVGGALNLFQRANHALPPTDGVTWIKKSDGGIYADKVEKGLAASRAGISAGDKLLGIGFDSEKIDEITSPVDVQMYLETAGVDGNLTYWFQRPSYTFSNNYYFADLTKIDTYPRWSASIIFLTFVGLVWLGVGMFVLFKQGSHAPFVLHFAIVCLAAFVFQVYKPLGLGEDFDLAVSLLDDTAFAFFVPLFLHFCIRYPVRSEIFDEARWKTYALYVPATLISLGILSLSLIFYFAPNASFVEGIAKTIDNFDLLTLFYRINFYHFIAGITAGSGFLIWRFVKNKKHPLVRQRLKWAMWGTIVAVLPIFAFQIAGRFVYIPQDSWTSGLTILPLALIPLQFRSFGCSLPFDGR